jgi:hypothetical protein
MLTKELGVFVTLLIPFACVAIEIAMWVTSEFGRTWYKYGGGGGGCGGGDSNSVNRRRREEEKVVVVVI